MSVRTRHKQPDFLASILLVLGRALWSLISRPFRRRRRVLDAVIYRQHWQTVELLGGRQRDEQSWKQAIVEADKLTDQAFRELQLSGQTFGERLRAAQARLPAAIYQDLWDAHKLRNQIAHEVGHRVTASEVQAALRHFECGLRSLGAL